MHKKTPEEKFLFKAYAIAQSKNDVFTELNYFAVGELLGQKKHQVKVLVQHLARSTFIKKREEGFFILTSKAVEFVKNH